MKLDDFVPFGRPQSDYIIDDRVGCGTAMPCLFRKQSKALNFMTENRMSQCTYLENI